MVFSILTPSLLSVLDENSEIVLLTDTNEKESQSEKEAEKKFDEKDLFLNNIHFGNSHLIQARVLCHSKYVFHNSDFIVDIILPPPRVNS